MPDNNDDSGGGSASVNNTELLAFIERSERLIAEKKEIAEQEKEVYAEAKGRGYDVKIMRKVIALRARDPEDVSEEDAVFDLYKSAVGL